MEERAPARARIPKKPKQSAKDSSEVKLYDPDGWRARFEAADSQLAEWPPHSLLKTILHIGKPLSDEEKILISGSSGAIIIECPFIDGRGDRESVFREVRHIETQLEKHGGVQPDLVIVNGYDHGTIGHYDVALVEPSVLESYIDAARIVTAQQDAGEKPTHKTPIFVVADHERSGRYLNADRFLSGEIFERAGDDYRRKDAATYIADQFARGNLTRIDISRP